MKKMFLFNTFIFCFLIFSSCNSKSVSTEQIKPLTIEDMSNSSSNTKDSITGYWFFPHNATTNITFNVDRTFVFDNYNFDNDKTEILYGTYDLHDNELTLKCKNGKKFTFKYEKGNNIDQQSYIKNADYYFVKSDNINSK